MCTTYSDSVIHAHISVWVPVAVVLCSIGLACVACLVFLQFYLLQFHVEMVLHVFYGIIHIKVTNNLLDVQ